MKCAAHLQFRYHYQSETKLIVLAVNSVALLSDYLNSPPPAHGIMEYSAIVTRYEEASLQQITLLCYRDWEDKVPTI